MEHTYDFDLAVIGSGLAAKRLRSWRPSSATRCALSTPGWSGASASFGTIPSKTLREAVLYLTGMQLRDLYGAGYRVRKRSISDLLARLQHVVGRETEVIRSQLMRNHIELVPGTASFLDPHAYRRDRRRGSASHPDRKLRRHRDRHRRPIRRTSTSTACVSSIRIRSSRWTPCRAPWWWSAPASSAWSTPRCSLR